MSKQRYEAEEIVAAIPVAAAAECSIRRFGAQDREVERRESLRALVSGSRVLSGALAKFADSASAHGRGVHCSSGMDAEVTAVNTALANLICAMQQAAQAMGVPAPVSEYGVPITASRAEAPHDDAIHANWLPLRLPQTADRMPEQGRV